MNNEKIVLILFSIIIIASVAIMLYTLLPTSAPVLENNGTNFQAYAARADPNDICAVPTGTDPEEWKEHLSHHPDIYAECLK